MLRIGSIIINVSDMSRAAEFWGMAIRSGSVNEDESTVLVPADTKCPVVTLDGNDACTWTCMSIARRSSSPR